MIKLQELLELREMVYTNEIPKKHKKRFTRKTPHFGDFPITYKDFPENDSKVTLSEVKLLSKIEPSPMLVKEYDEVEDTFKKALEVTDFNADTKYIDDIVHESVKYIMELKYKYNRPRPYQIAAFYGIDLNGTELDSMKTPSYPSGHAVQGYLVADILSQQDPENEVIYQAVGEDIAHSRLIAKAHYPSDKEYGRVIATELFIGLK